ncbi:MAG: hypothetical protein ACKVP7_03970, partial [Hyphomicrobiaceae bacterium]
EGARPRQGVGAGPVTDTLGRPSQGVLENRTAAPRTAVDVRRDNQDIRFRTRRALMAIGTSEQQLLAASQRAARQSALEAIDAGLSVRHAGAIAAVVARFADRKAALTDQEPSARADAMRALAAEEVHELARLALEHAAEKRALRKSVVLSLAAVHRIERRSMRTRNRRQRIMAAVVMQPRERPRADGATRTTARRATRLAKIHEQRRR